MELGDAKNPGLAAKILEFVIGIVCYALFLKYGFFVCDVSGLSFTTIITNAMVKECAVRESIMIATVVAYPFIITPSLIIASLKHKEFHRNLLSILLPFGGFVCFVTAGALQAANLPGDNTTLIGLTPAAYKALASLLIINSGIYLSDMIYHLKMLRSG